MEENVVAAAGQEDDSRPTSHPSTARIEENVVVPDARRGLPSHVPLQGEGSEHPMMTIGSQWIRMRPMFPSDLLMNIATPAGGRVVLVVGAGCSSEPPTNLPSSKELSQEAYRQLIADGVIAEGDCTDPSDLSCLADAVIQKKESQAELVQRLRPERFRNAPPNEGHRLAAALLCEGKLAAVLTLNFDLSLSHALADVGAGELVSVIAKPEDGSKLGPSNIIYLHRNVDADPEDWVLSSSSVGSNWEKWQDVITNRVLATPITVFVGLGTRVGVLIATTQRIRDALPPGATKTFQVDPDPRDTSVYARELNLSEGAYIQMGWIDFMRRLAFRLLEEHHAELKEACRELQQNEGLNPEDVSGICAGLEAGGLMRLGRLRARWMLFDNNYARREDLAVPMIADLLLGAALVERTTHSECVLGDDGVGEYRTGDRTLGAIVFASGRGSRGWTTLEAEITRNAYHWEHRNPRPHWAIVAGVNGLPGAVAAPKSIVSQDDEESILSGWDRFEMISVQQLRDDPQLASMAFKQ